MIDLIIGVPGSGKTYFAVNKIYDLITAKDKKYKHIFTNINGFQYDKANKLANEVDYVRSFDFPHLKQEMQKEFEFHTLSKNISNINSKISLKFTPLPDDIVASLDDNKKQEYQLELHEYHKSQVKKQMEIKLKDDYDNFVKSQGVFSLYEHSLIFIDECHLYFEDRSDDVLIRFLSYHRHFEIDLVLITQNKNLINKKYLSFIETMFVAYPASKRFFSKSFRYKKFASYQEYHANIIGTTSLKLSKVVFSLYSSGSNQLGKSILAKMLLPIFLLVLAVSVGFYFLYSSFEPNKSKLSKTIASDKNISKVISTDHNNLSTFPDPLLNTNYFLSTCFQKSCFFKSSDASFNKVSMFKLFDVFHCKVILTNSTDVNYLTYLLQCDKNLHSVLKLFNSKNKNFGAKKNEKPTSVIDTSGVFGR